MRKQKIHWFQWDCLQYKNGLDSYTDVPGLVTCGRCKKKVGQLLKEYEKRKPVLVVGFVNQIMEEKMRENDAL